MTAKAMLVDVSKCIGCRACQVACKNWNGLPADPTKNRGGYQNPSNLNPHTFTLVRFQEMEEDSGAVKWLFRNDRCFHCSDPGCMKSCPVPGCITKTPDGAVVLHSEKCIGCKYCINACPFEIPRFDEKTEKIYKCNFCHDRQTYGLMPACAKACSTEALVFGDKDTIIQSAYNRAQELGGKAAVYGDQFVGGTHVMYVLAEPAGIYTKLPENPRVSTAIYLWKNVLKPLSMFSLLGGIGAGFLYYITKGPKRPKFDEGGKNNE